jgi:hypothetical protein
MSHCNNSTNRSSLVVSSYLHPSAGRAVKETLSNSLAFALVSSLKLKRESSSQLITLARDCGWANTCKHLAALMKDGSSV